MPARVRNFLTVQRAAKPQTKIKTVAEIMKMYSIPTRNVEDFCSTNPAPTADLLERKSSLMTLNIDFTAKTTRAA